MLRTLFVPLGRFGDTLVEVAFPVSSRGAQAGSAFDLFAWQIQLIYTLCIHIIYQVIDTLSNLLSSDSYYIQ